ncbi:MAG: hypothetical protein V4724_32655 [Pseudomonadota bacterium]
MKKDQLVQLLEEQLRTVKAERQSGGRDPALHAARVALKDFQSRRLGATHADLMARPDTHAAVMFFLQDLYGSHDLSQRDTDLARIVPTMQRVLPFDALKTITDAIVLDALAERLDTAMAMALGPVFGADDYVRAYRGTARADRERQLELVRMLGDSLSELVRIPMLWGTLVLMRGPAKVAGLASLQQFLERGFSAFKKMRTPREFVATITRRESAILVNSYAGRADPFDVA